jgi:hypothetical protein
MGVIRHTTPGRLRVPAPARPQRRTIQVRPAGVASVLHTASVAPKVTAWVPWAKPLYFLGEDHAPKVPLSREHSKVLPAS